MSKFRHVLLAGAVGLTALLSACGSSHNAGNTAGSPSGTVDSSLKIRHDQLPPLARGGYRCI